MISAALGRAALRGRPSFAPRLVSTSVSARTITKTFSNTPPSVRQKGQMVMKFAKRVFLIAGVYGLIVVLPMYLLEDKTGRDFPPAITHPEYYYGFIGVTVAWQILFLILSKDPIRYRLMMIPAILEKASFGVAIIVLFLQERDLYFHPDGGAGRLVPWRSVCTVIFENK